MTVNELYKLLDGLIPASLSCDWDNDGMMICPDGNKEVKSVYFCLDLTEARLERAIAKRYDLIITHHPLIFNKIGSITNPLYIRAIKKNMPVFSFHTRLDALHPGGVNDALAGKTGLSDVVPLDMMCVGKTGTDDLTDFAKSVKTALMSDRVSFADGGKPVNKVAVLGGKCSGEYFDLALENGCDTVVTGEAGYNTVLDYKAKGLNIITAGHYYTEYPVLDSLADLVSSKAEGIENTLKVFSREVKSV